MSEQQQSKTKEQQAYGKVVRKGKLKFKASSNNTVKAKNTQDIKNSNEDGADKEKTTEAVDERAKQKSDRYCK
jgi:hypothetical protein